jgi:transposase
MMAGKPKPMSQIKQLLQLHKQGKSKKEIARILGISRNTVKSYLRKIEESSLHINELLKLEVPLLEGKFHAGNPSYKEDRYEHFKANVNYFLKELKRLGVTKQLLWEEYKASYPDGYSHSQFCFHLNQQEVAARPSAVLHHDPADKLYIDFAGKTLSYIDKSTGEVINCQVFVACLPYSDYCFAMAVKSQCVEDFIYALTCCLNHLGGAPKALVPDNLKAAVIKADRYEPSINTAMDDLANYYGTTVVLGRARKPKDKTLVENQVKLIYSRVYAKLRDRQFFSIQQLNDAISEKVLAHNQTRMQLKNYCREEKFLANEKHLLKALPDTVYEMKYYKQYKVAPNNHLCLQKDRHYYSVPFVHIGKQATVIYTRSTVSIYIDCKRVAFHLRSYVTGHYTTVKDHLCSTHQHYQDRSPDYYMAKAKSRSKELHNLFVLLFKQDRYPEQLYRTCDGLLKLQRITEPDKFEKACQIAIENQRYNYGFVANILKNNMTEHYQQTEEKPLPRHENIRGKQLFF